MFQKVQALSVSKNFSLFKSKVHSALKTFYVLMYYITTLHIYKWMENNPLFTFIGSFGCLQVTRLRSHKIGLRHRSIHCFAANSCVQISFLFTSTRLSTAMVSFLLISKKLSLTTISGQNHKVYTQVSMFIFHIYYKKS